MKNIKNLLGITFTKKGLVQTAEGIFINVNVGKTIKRLNNINFNTVDITPVDALLKPNLKLREIRTLSYNIIPDEFKIIKDIIELIKDNWTKYLLNGLIHSLLSKWHEFSYDVRKLLIDTINEKSDKDAAYIQYINENGSYKLGYNLRKANEPILNCCQKMNLPNNRFTYKYFSETIIAYYENRRIDQREDEQLLEDIISILNIHNYTRTTKIVLSNLISYNYFCFSNPKKLSDLAYVKIGNPENEALWSSPEDCSSEQQELINKARRILIKAISEKFINLFFTELAQENQNIRRLNYWRKHSNYIQNFKIYGPAKCRDSMITNLNSQIVDRYFIPLDNSIGTCALIMYCKDFVIIEFTDVGAIYVYKKDSKIYQAIFNSKIQKIEDLKIPTIQQIIDYSYYGEVYREEGRLIHSGDWETRLNNWMWTKLGDNAI